MPNLLAHYGAQLPVTRAVRRHADVRWILLGVLVPDLPWILQRAVVAAAPGVDVFDLRLYATAQASLFVCLLACAALACLARRASLVFAVLAGNALLHLLLDACQTKWGNGVHLLAPVSWQLWNLGLFWPESPPTLALTAAGAAVASFAVLRSPGTPEPLARPSRRRALLAAGLGLAWLLLPLAFRAPVEASDSHYVGTLRARDARPGRIFEVDRGDLVRRGGGPALRVWTGEDLPVVAGAPEGGPGQVSVRARFVDAQRIEILACHRHVGLWRDAASYAALVLLGAAWTRPLWRP